jgi:ACS family hexuronate transporter-like MFS transporter
MPRPIRNLRWWIGGMLFASTVINYIDRQTLSTLAPFLKKEYEWTNTDYAMLVIAFRLSYSIGQTVFGRVMDRVGTRRGLTLSVISYSLVSMMTALARGWSSFAFFRFLLGAAESPNWPAATKAVAEWFPRRERGLATALFDSGSSIGGAIAPFLSALRVAARLHHSRISRTLLGAGLAQAGRLSGDPPPDHPRRAGDAPRRQARFAG